MRVLRKWRDAVEIVSLRRGILLRSHEPFTAD